MLAKLFVLEQFFDGTDGGLIARIQKVRGEFDQHQRGLAILTPQQPAESPVPIGADRRNGRSARARHFRCGDFGGLQLVIRLRQSPGFLGDSQQAFPQFEVTGWIGFIDAIVDPLEVALLKLFRLTGVPPDDDHNPAGNELLGKGLAEQTFGHVTRNVAR